MQDLPMYNEARGAAVLTSVPPFQFTGMTSRVFPLLADQWRLKLFVDQFLNVMPREIGYFEPAAGMVLLQALNYGKMSVETANLGWVAQNEVFFAVPLRWYRMVDGKPQFQNWALVTPFIYVDSATSLVTGRMVFGWPKVRGWLSSECDAWTLHPRRRRRLLTLTAQVFAEGYAGRHDEPRPLLEIDADPQPSFSLFPFDPQNPLNPWVSIPTGFANNLGLMIDLTKGLVEDLLGHRGHNIRAQTRQFVSTLRSNMQGEPFIDVINLKQFRDAATTGGACYQGVTATRMTTHQINGAGLLGDQQMLLGDISGGYKIRLHRYKSQPIVETLGLVIQHEEHAGGQQVDVLKPIYPFWLDLDMSLDHGTTLGWCGLGVDWVDTIGGETPHYPPRRDREESKRERFESQEQGRPAGMASLPPPSERDSDCRYNTARTGALQAIEGPFWFPDMTVRVLPLLADREVLTKFCDDYLNKEQDQLRFRPWGSYVYMLVHTIEEMASEVDDIGWWARREVSFAIPVLWERRIGDEWRLESMAMLKPFLFADSSIAAISAREVYGQPTAFAEIESPGSSWLDSARPVNDSSGLMDLRMDLLPTLDKGQEIENRLLLQVFCGDLPKPKEPADQRFVVDEWGRMLRDELRRLRHSGEEESGMLDRQKALALELLANGEAFNEIILKQFRDLDDPFRACYQALVLARHHVDRVFEIREIDDLLHVAIHRYANQPLVQALGLCVKESRTQEGSGPPVDYLQPIRPFWLRGAFRFSNAERLAWRAGSREWFMDPRAPGYLAGGDAPTGVDVPVLDELAVGKDPYRKLRHRVKDWQERSDSHRLTQSEAAAAISNPELDPQTVIGAILSEEWEHWGRSRRSRGLKQRPLSCSHPDSLGPDSDAERELNEWFDPEARSEQEALTPKRDQQQESEPKQG